MPPGLLSMASRPSSRMSDALRAIGPCCPTLFDQPEKRIGVRDLRPLDLELRARLALKPGDDGVCLETRRARSMIAGHAFELECRSRESARAPSAPSRGLLHHSAVVIEHAGSAFSRFLRMGPTIFAE